MTERRQRLLGGSLSAMIGLLTAAMIYLHPENLHAPAWVAYAACSAFVFAGLTIMAYEFALHRTHAWLAAAIEENFPNTRVSSTRIPLPRFALRPAASLMIRQLTVISQRAFGGRGPPESYRSSAFGQSRLASDEHSRTTSPMPKGYWITSYRSVSDPTAHSKYAALAGPAIAAFGGRFLARGMPFRTSEAAPDQRCVVVEFDSVDDAVAAYESPAYQAALVLLDGAAQREVRILEGAEKSSRAVE